MTLTDLLCLGEPLVEFNLQPDGSYRAGFGGDVSNVAIAAARQGARTGIVTHVGADPFGDDLISLWGRENVGTDHVKRKPGQDTGLYFVHHDSEGHHFIYRRKGSACSQMTTADLPKSAMSDTRMFYTSAIALAVSDTLRDATINAVSLARKSNVMVAFDPNLREHLWSLDQARSITHEVMKNCDIALPGLDDARRLTGLQSLEEIIRFYHNLGATVVALTLGSDGVAISTGQQIAMLPAIKVDAVDATGAGDCFNGVFLSSYLSGASPEDAAQSANIGAALSTTGFGAVAPIPTSNEIKNLKETTT